MFRLSEIQGVVTCSAVPLVAGSFMYNTPASSTMSSVLPAACTVNDPSPCALVTPEPVIVTRLPPASTTSLSVSFADLAAMVA